MHLVHNDRNYIYNFLPREGESIALAWGSLKSMLYSCANHELSFRIFMLGFLMMIDPLYFWVIKTLFWRR